MLQRAFVSAAVVVSTCALAQDGLKADRPEVKVGDAWTYERVNRDGSRLDVRHEIKAVAPDALTVVVVDAAGTTEQQWTPELNYVRGEGQRVLRPHQQYVSFPLTVGREWKVETKGISTSGREAKSDGACKVVTFEKVATKAGAFDAFKVECNTEFTLYGRTPLFGRDRYLYWYAPALRGVVRAERLTRDAVSVFADWTQELVATTVN